MTIEQVAERLLCSPSKVSRMETGHRGTSQRDIRDLCALFDVANPDQREHLATLAKEGKEQAWWQPFNLPFSYATYVGLEAEATRISDYLPGFFSGILQTPEYARAIHENGIPRLADELIDERVQVRLSRQAILTRKDPPAPNVRSIVDEAVLRRLIGGPAVMRAQLEHIAQVATLPNVTVQILSFAAGAHPALSSTFSILDFPAPVPTVVYSEGLVGQFYLEARQDIDRYEHVFEYLRSVALSPQASLELTMKAISEYQQI